MDDVVGANGQLGLNKIMNYLTNDTGKFSINYTAIPAVQKFIPLQGLNIVRKCPSEPPLNVNLHIIFVANWTKWKYRRYFPVDQCVWTKHFRDV